MMRPLERLVDLWIGRRGTADPEARAEMAIRAPAVVVTGGSYGIGAALAAEFARRGSHALVLVARNEAPLAECAERLSRAFGIRVETLALDLADAGSSARVMDFVRDHGLYVDYLVANAGIGLSGPFACEAEHRINALIDLNIRSLTELVHKALPGMLARARGGILTIASLAGYVPGPHQAIYYASKAYVLSLTEAIRHEVKGRGVRIAVSAPGPVETAFHESMGAASALYRDLVPSETPERVARRTMRGFMLGRTVIVPGLVETALAWVLRITPHPISVPLVGALLTRRDGSRGKK